MLTTIAVASSESRSEAEVEDEALKKASVRLPLVVLSVRFSTRRKT